MRRVIPGLLLLLIAGAACSEKIPDVETIVLGCYDEPATLNPLVPPEGFTHIILKTFTDSLVRYSGGSAPGPDLADSWDISKDGLTWTFHLRKGVHFSDGTELTADDVQFTYEKGSDPKYGNQFTDFSQIVKSFRPDGRYNFRISLKTPFSLLPSLLGRPIVPRHLLQGGERAEAEFGRHPVGSGPFMLSDWTPGQLTLDANPRYFLGRPRVGRVIFKLFPDNKKAWVSLVRGQVDFVLDVDYEDYALIKDDARFKGYELPDNFCCSLVFNTRDPLFEERRIRQAVAMAIDRTDLVDTVLSGKGLAAHGPFKPGTWPYNPDPLLQAYDPGRAAKILSDLGWKDTDGDWVLDKDGRKLEFTVLDTGEDRLRGAAAKRLQWQLLQIGIRMNVAVLSLHEVRVKRIPAGDFQAVLTQFNVLPDPDRSATEVWHSASIGGRNVAGYRNPEVDRLIERGRISSDFNERKGIYREMYARISQDAPAAFLFFRKRFAAASSRLQGITDQGVSAPCGSMRDWYLK